MIIKRLDLKKLKINGAECTFEKAGLIISREEIPLESYLDECFEWDIEVKGGKSHVDFDKLFDFNVKVELYFEAIDQFKVKGKGLITGILVAGESYEEIDIAVREWEVAV